MCRSGGEASPRRARLLLALLSGLLTVLAARAAPPADVLLELRIDGRSTEQVGRFVLLDGVPHASADEWRALGFAVPPGTPEPVSVAAMTGVQARVDTALMLLDLSLPPDLSRLTLVGAAADPAADEQPGSFGALLNYDLSAQSGTGRARQAAWLEGRAFGAKGVFEQTLLVARQPVRLDSTFVHSDAQALRRLRVGDFVGVALGWTRPLRLGGVQLMTDFALRPDLVTAPTPQLAGQATVPSTVDVLVNGIRQLSQPVEPGRFEVRQPPLVSGLGEIGVVVRDALGRESVQTLSFYTSLRLLAPGLSAYALELGRVRHGFGVDSADYRDVAALATLRRGVSERLTLEAHAEATHAVGVAGAGALLKAGEAGVLSASLAFGTAYRGRPGWQTSLGAERQTALASFGLQWTHADARYRDVAATQGDARLRDSARLGAGFPLGRRGTIGLAVVASRSETDTAPPLRTRVASATWNVALGQGGLQLSTSAYRDLMRDGSAGVALTLAVPLGQRGGLSAGIAHERQGSSLSLQAAQAALLPGEFGWRLQSDERVSGTAATRRLAGAEYLAPWVRAAFEAEQLAGRSAVRVDAQGALVALGGRVYATSTVHDSFALVDLAGQPGVAVYHENRLVGRTDDRGQIIVPGLLSHLPNRVGVDPLDLPLDAELTTTVRAVRPAERVGVLVPFGLERTRAALLVLHDADGMPLPLGAHGVLGPGGARFVVGHDGQAYVSGLRASNEITLHWGAGAGCTARFTLDATEQVAGRIGPLRCE